MTTFNVLINEVSTTLAEITIYEPKNKQKKNLCQCGKAQPIYNYPNIKPAVCCSKCKKIGMENIKDKKCVCGKAIPVYNYESEKKPKYCNYRYRYSIDNLSDLKRSQFIAKKEKNLTVLSNIKIFNYTKKWFQKHV